MGLSRNNGSWCVWYALNVIKDICWHIATEAYLSCCLCLCARLLAHPHLSLYLTLSSECLSPPYWSLRLHSHIMCVSLCCCFSHCYIPLCLPHWLTSLFPTWHHLLQHVTATDTSSEPKIPCPSARAVTANQKPASKAGMENEAEIVLVAVSLVWPCWLWVCDGCGSCHKAVSHNTSHLCDNTTPPGWSATDAPSGQHYYTYIQTYIPALYMQNIIARLWLFLTSLYCF